MEFQRIGRYEIVGQLGHGAMGTVYKATDPLMDRTVAVKTILAAALAGPQAAEYRERFQREARAAGRLSHPGIITVYDVGEHEGLAYLVMEYVAGRTLAAALDTGERFSFERIYETGQQLAEALGYAHAAGVIHRDIKPANILLAAPAGGGPERAKIMDFGVAKLSAAQVTVTGQLLGTPSFMPPEQFTGATLDGRGDIFSLGVILYWMATGDKPFSGDTITAVSYKIVHTETIPPRRLNPAISQDFENVIVRCLQKDPAMRYATGEALARDLAALREGRAPDRTVIARPGRALDPDATADLHHPRTAPPPQSSVAATQAAPAEAAGKRWSKKHIFLAVLAILILLNVIKRDRNETQRDPAPAPQTDSQSQPQKSADAPVIIPKQVTIAPEDPSAAAAKENSQAAAPAPPPAPGKVRDTAELVRRANEQTAEALRKAELDKAAQARWFEQGERQGASRQFLFKGPEKPPDPPQEIPAGKARLRIDASRLPHGMQVFVQAAGGFAFRSSEPEHAGKRVFENQFLFPGAHTFHVAVGAGTMRLGSERVSGEFAAGQARTLRIELIFPDGTAQPRRDDRSRRVFGGDLRITLE